MKKLFSLVLFSATSIFAQQTTTVVQPIGSGSGVTATQVTNIVNSIAVTSAPPIGVTELTNTPNHLTNWAKLSTNSIPTTYWGTNATLATITNINIGFSTMSIGKSNTWNIPSGRLDIGDLYGAGNNTVLTIDDASSLISTPAGVELDLGNVVALGTIGFTGKGTALTDLNASNLGSGTVPTARLGSGAASSSTYLRGDQTWATITTGPTFLGDPITNGQAQIFTLSNVPTIKIPVASGTVSNGLAMTNASLATVGAQEYSPALIWGGNGWKTTATAGSQPVAFRQYVIPVQSATSPGAYLRLESQTNNGSWGFPFDFSFEGNQTNFGDWLVVGDKNHSGNGLNIFADSGLNSAIISHPPSGGILQLQGGNGPGNITIASAANRSLTWNGSAFYCDSGDRVADLGTTSQGFRGIWASKTASLNGTTGLGFGTGDVLLQSSATAELVLTNGTAASSWATLVTKQHGYSTNLSTMAPDFRLYASSIVTNAAFTFLAPIGVDQTRYETVIVAVTNSTAVAIAATAPANVRVTSGAATMFVTNMTEFTFSHYGNYYTNVSAKPIF